VGTRWPVLALAGVATFFASFDGSVLVLGLPAIARDFNASVPAITDLGSALALGTLAALPMAMLADRLGRRRLLAVAVAGFSVANLASAAAPTLAWLAALRAVSVAFETVAAGVATALVVEEVEPGRRGLAVAGITITAGAGIGLTTVLYPLVAPNWRLLYALGGSGLVAAMALARWLPESRLWAATRPERIPLAMLWLPPWRRRLLLFAASAALGAILYEPAGLLVALFGSRELGLDPRSISAVVVVSGLASVPAFVAGGRLSDRYGRRLLGVLLSVVTALFAALAFGGDRSTYWAGNILWSVSASASVPVFGAWAGELFPTRARATSESCGSVAAALGGILGLQLVGLLQPRLGLGPSLVLASTGALAGAVLLLLLPETRGEPLPE
jgi:predicted MFS family arabinose efflux permease